MKVSKLLRLLSFFSCIGYALSCNANQVILVLGDSLSAGYGLQPNQGWVNLLVDKLAEKKLDYSIINYSQSGETAAEGLERLPQQLTQTNPQLVILALGSNDGLRLTPIMDINITISHMIDLIKATPAQILLVGFKLPRNFPQDYRAAFEAVFPAISSHYDVKLVPFLMEGMDNVRYFQPDNLHPTAAAQPIMMENVWKYLEPMLNKS